MADIRIEEHVPLAPFTTLGIGGSARFFATASTAADAAAAHRWALSHDQPLFVLGGGSNLVVADAGVDGLVLRVNTGGIEFESVGDATRVTAAAGEPWDRVVGAVVTRGLAGIECLSGIPGTVGGTPIQNVGAYGQEVGDTIESVTAFDTRSAEVVTLSREDCQFTYRQSALKTQLGRFVVLGVTFVLRSGSPAVRYPDLSRWLERAGIEQPSLADVRAAVLAVRRSKGMVVDVTDPDSRSVGSFFMNPVVSAASLAVIARASAEHPPAFAVGPEMFKVPAAWLIERAGFAKGFVDGTVGLSTKHPLAVVNRGHATARDVLRLATRIKRDVVARVGVLLRPEPIFVGFGDDPDVRYLRGE